MTRSRINSNAYCFCEAGAQDYGRRFYDPQIGRFTTIDPLAEHFPWMTCYQYASNNPVKNIDLDGLEGLLLGINETLSPLEALARAGGEVAGKTVEVGGTGAKGPRFTPQQLENFARGNKTEAEQLAKNGLEKNTESITRIDPKTGKEGKTIPDALKNDGKSTSEVKHVQEQGLTKQLRLQKEYSNENGFKPELIINEGAKISKPLQKAGFDIKTYEVIPPVVVPQDNMPAVQKPIPFTPVEEKPRKEPIQWT